MTIRATKLKCEYMINPLGIDVLQPRLSWIMESNERAQKQTAYRILVASTKEKLFADEADLWDTGKVDSEQSTHIVYKGSGMKSALRCWWKVQVWDKNRKASEFSEPAWWEMGLLEEEEWKVNWVGLAEEFTPKFEEIGDKAGLPCPYLRKSFTVNKQIAEARLYATSLGVYELYMNGNRVGEDLFNPGWTDYHKRIQYQTYDVTGLLAAGENVIGAILGDGWYAGNIAITGRHQYGTAPLKLKAQLHIQYTDGSSEILTTDRNWKGTTGPILYSDIQTGEYYDARKELDNWNKPGFDDSKWHVLDLLDGLEGKLAAQVGPTVKVMKEMFPVEITQPVKDTYIFDMAQNMVGWVSLKVKGEAGTKVTLRFGEMLNEDGTLYTENLRSARATEVYILKGAGEEVYEPRFTFHGFRYVEVTGYPGEPDLKSITGKVIHSETPETGKFECSHPMVNQLQSNITWGQRGNFLSVPTDCPQRDERMGWTGDAQVFVRTACSNMDVSAFFTKWMKDVEDAQKPTGAFTDVVPNVKWSNGNDLVGVFMAAWGDAGVIVPWTIYQCYGDTRMIETHYDAMTRWIGYLKENSTGLLRPDHGCGDWLSINAETPKDMLATAFFAYSTRLLAKMAKVIGRKDDAAKYENLFQEIKAAFNQAYVSPDGRITGNTQCCYLLALKFDLLPDEKRSLAAKYLVEAIEEKDWHLSTGFIGVGYLLPILSEMGYTEVAYRLLLNETYPSWGYSIKNGATTIWERWNSYTKEDGFGDVSMNSFNHYSLGSVGEWFYRYAAGIELDEREPGYKHMIIRPCPGGGFTFARAEFESMYGKIISDWRINEEKFILYIEIPANASARVYLPIRKGVQVKESGIPVEQNEGIVSYGYENEHFIIDVGSGTYKFEAMI